MLFAYSCVFLLALFGVGQAGFLHGGLVTTSYGVGIGGSNGNGGSGQGQGQSQGSQGPQTNFGGGLVNTVSYGQPGPIATSSSYRQQITNSVPAVTTYAGVAAGTAYPQYVNGNGAGSGLQGGHAIVNTNNGFGGYGHY